MNTDFERNRSKPGDPGYKYDVQVTVSICSRSDELLIFYYSFLLVRHRRKTTGIEIQSQTALRKWH